MNTNVKLNELIVPTFRWLKVNEFNANIDLYAGENYSNLEVISPENIVSKLEGYEGENENYGVNKEIVKFIENHYNIGTKITVPDNTKLKEPVILNFSSNKDNKVLQDLNIIELGKNSESVIIIDYRSMDETELLHEGSTKVYSGENSTVKIIKIQNLSSASTSYDSNVAYLGRNAKCSWISVELGAGTAISNYENILKGENSEVFLDSIYFGDGSSKTDVSYTMTHLGKRTNSQIKTYGVLTDEATKTFRGNLDFKHGAVKSKGKEEEFVLILSPKVKSDSVPTLLCDEDDVEGQHAASVGQIDENKLFYLMSRGLTEGEAKKLIIEASFGPVIDAIPMEDIRLRIQEEIHRRIING